jgi:hypothetical protein
MEVFSIFNILCITPEKPESAKSIMIHKLFIYIDRFDKWAEMQSGTPQDERGGEWECSYDEWNSIYEAFADFMISKKSEEWTGYENERLLYIIARDNEMEVLSEILSKHEKALIHLARESIRVGHKDDKWQIAVQLTSLKDDELAIDLLEQFVNDEDEYVNRRALLELAKLKSKTVEFYCEQFWNRHKYGDSEEYQRIAVLHALNEVNSIKLGHYIELAFQDGREYLVKTANDLLDCK